MTVEVYHGSVLEAPADIIVSTANTELTPVAGLARAVAQAAGPEVTHQLRRQGVIPLGHAVVTTGGRLRAKSIVHVTTRDALMLGNPTHLADIERGTRSALQLCMQMGADTVAFPLLGAGDVGLPRKEVVQTMLRVFDEFPVLKLLLCAFTPADREAVAFLERLDQ